MLKTLTLLLLLKVIETVGEDFILTPPVLSDNNTGNEADSHSHITWSSLPEVDDDTSGTAGGPHGGWETYYALMHSFVSSVFAKGLPTDLIIKAVNFDEELVQNYQSYINYILGYAVCAGVGILFVLVFPIVSCCFCCCRCAGKCGGKRNQSEKDAQNACKKNAYTVIVVIATTFLGVGMVALLNNNDKLSDSLASVGDTFKDNIDDIRHYLNNTVRQVERIVIDDLNFMEAVISRDLDNIGFLVGHPLQETIENRTDIRTTLTTAYRLSADLTAVDDSLEAINKSLNDLEQSVNKMGAKMTAIQQNLTQIFTECKAVPGCPTSAPNIDSLTPGIDSTQFPDISSQTASLDDAMKTNLTEKIVDAEDELDDIPQRVQNDSAAVRNDTKLEIAKLKDEVDPIITEFRDINDMLNEDASSVDDLESDIDYYSDLIRPYDKYRRYAGIAMFGLVLLVVIGNCFGIGLGVLGGGSSGRPHERGCTSNAGGCLLMVSVGVILSISAIFMLLTTLTFILGAPLEMVVCKNLKDLDTLKELEREYTGDGKYELGRLVHDNESVALTFSGLLTACKSNKPIFEAVQLEKRFDIDDMLNYSQYFDIKAEVDRINVDLSSVNVYSADLKAQLDDFRDALNIDFNGFYGQMSNLTSEDSLNDTIDELEDFAAKVSGITTVHDKLVIQIAAIRSLQTTDYVAVQADIIALNDSLVAMETSISGLKPLIDTLDVGLADTDRYIKNNASDDIKTLLTSYTERLLSVVDSFVGHAGDSVKAETGRCRPVWDVYESIFIHTLCGGLVDALNGFWFSLGWCVFVFLPSLVFSVKISKFFKRMEPPAPKKKDELPRKRPISKADLWLRSNKVHHYDNDKDCSSMGKANKVHLRQILSRIRPYGGHSLIRDDILHREGGLPN